MAFTTRKLARILSEGRHLDFSEQLKFADFLTDSTDCWEALHDLAPRKKPWEPETASLPVVRALRRVLHPRFDLTLSSLHLRQVREIELPSSKFISLLLEEAIHMALRDPAHGLTYLKVPRGLMAVASLSENWNSDFFRPLNVRLECACVHLLLKAGKRSHAGSHLLAAKRAARGLVSESYLADFRLAEFHLACGQPGAFLYLQEALAQVAADPIRVFEMASDGMTQLADPHLSLEDAEWVISHLSGIENHSDKVVRLSGLFHKACFVTQSLRDSDFKVFAPSIAEQLGQAEDDVGQLGDRYSQAKYHQLQAELQEPFDVKAAAASFDQALKIYAELKLASPYKAALIRLYHMPGLPDSLAEEYVKRAGRRATRTFTKAEAWNMQRAISNQLYSVPASRRFHDYINVERWLGGLKVLPIVE